MNQCVFSLFLSLSPSKQTGKGVIKQAIGIKYTSFQIS